MVDGALLLESYIIGTQCPLILADQLFKILILRVLSSPVYHV